MTQLIHLASEFDKRFRALEDFFNTLSTSQKSFVHKPSLPIPPPATVENTSALSLPPPPVPETTEDPLIEHFHSTADHVIEILCELQPLVRLKQTHLPSGGMSSSF